MMKLIALGIFGLVGLIGGNERASLFECVGCGGTPSAPFSNSVCITINVVNALSCSSGTCGTPPCVETAPCKANGEVTIIENGCGPAYVRSITNNNCNPGTVTIAQGGQQSYTYNDHKLACGADFKVRVFLSDPGDGCSGGSAGWGFTCAICQLTHG